jgi:hypothetical protein
MSCTRFRFLLASSSILNTSGGSRDRRAASSFLLRRPCRYLHVARNRSALWYVRYSGIRWSISGGRISRFDDIVSSTSGLWCPSSMLSELQTFCGGPACDRSRTEAYHITQEHLLEEYLGDDCKYDIVLLESMTPGRVSHAAPHSN